jgi:uncharacterized protein
MPRTDEYDHNSQESAMHVLEVRNDELMDSITRQAAERGITYAAIVALIGAVDSFTVSTTPASDPTAHTYSSYPLPAEMTATGEIVDGKPHIHAVMAVQGDRTIGRTSAQGGAWHLVCPRLRDPLRASRRRARQRGDRVRRGPGQSC